MTGLADAAEDYLALRRGLGFKLERPGQLLADFAGYLDACGATTVTTELAEGRRVSRPSVTFVGDRSSGG